MITKERLECSRVRLSAGRFANRETGVAVLSPGAFSFSNTRLQYPSASAARRRDDEAEEGLARHFPIDAGDAATLAEPRAG